MKRRQMKQKLEKPSELGIYKAMFIFIEYIIGKTPFQCHICLLSPHHMRTYFHHDHSCPCANVLTPFNAEYPSLTMSI